MGCDVRYSVEELEAPFGVMVEGIDTFADLLHSFLAEIENLLASHRMVVLRGAAPSDEEQVRFARHFGPLNLFARVGLRDEQVPELVTFSNDPTLDGIVATQRLHWHTNLSYKPQVARYAVAHVPMDIPAGVGGRTGWTDTALAYDELDTDLKRAVEGLKLHHTQHIPGLDSVDVLHDVVRVADGRTALYDVGPVFRPDGDRPGRGKYFPALPVDESRELLGTLSEHSTQEAYQYTHTWGAGDVVIWDNITTMHMREAVTDPTFRRTLKVVDVLEDQPSGLAPCEVGPEEFMDA